jgi:hypothetical protein
MAKRPRADASGAWGHGVATSASVMDAQPVATRRIAMASCSSVDQPDIESLIRRGDVWALAAELGISDAMARRLIQAVPIPRPRADFALSAPRHAVSGLGRAVARDAMPLLPSGCVRLLRFEDYPLGHVVHVRYAPRLKRFPLKRSRKQ